MAGRGAVKIRSRGLFLELLKSPDLGVLLVSLDLLGYQPPEIRLPVSTPFSGDFGQPAERRDPPKSAITTLEAAPLTTNRFANVRLRAVNILQMNGDAKAKELARPMLNDPNSLVRIRAALMLR